MVRNEGGSLRAVTGLRMTDYEAMQDESRSLCRRKM